MVHCRRRSQRYRFHCLTVHESRVPPFHSESIWQFRGEKHEGVAKLSPKSANSRCASAVCQKKIDPAKVKAELKSGLLTVTAPIAEEAKAKKVDIHAA